MSICTTSVSDPVWRASCSWLIWRAPTGWRRTPRSTTLLDNCTTGIRLNVQHIGAAQPWDYRILVSGLGDQLLYERGNIDTSMPFEQLKAASVIVDKAKAATRR